MQLNSRRFFRWQNKEIDIRNSSKRIAHDSNSRRLKFKQLKCKNTFRTSHPKPAPKTNHYYAQNTRVANIVGTQRGQENAKKM